ncbi:MAG: PEP-CTERM sorting domain-containing protein [Pirellulales bacterium]|nr:PEP-CTERM sorting domain-containing protein [Pirellulales bacterium]
MHSIYDASSIIGTQIVGYRANETETIVGTDVEQNATDPAITFQFTSDGVSAYDVFVRENNDGNRSRLNAVTLSLIPEPTSLGLLGLVLFGLVLMRRKLWL